MKTKLVAAAALILSMGIKGYAMDAALPTRLHDHVSVLAEQIGERHPGRPTALWKAARYIQKEFQADGYDAELIPFEANGQVLFNVEARRPGIGRPIVIGAHYDSVPGSPGADDNASGVAVLLETARRARSQAHGRPLRFVAFANEESLHSSDMGSYHYVRYLGPEAKKLEGMICLEMVGYYRNEPGTQQYPAMIKPFYPSRGNFVALVSNLHSYHFLNELRAPLRGVRDIAFHATMLPSFIGGIDRSDHVHFWRAGIPAVMVSDTSFYRNANYHQTTDTVDSLDYTRMGALTENLAALLNQTAS